MTAETPAHVFYRNLLRPYPEIERAQGIYLYDREGREYIDGSAGAAVANIGHGRREIAAVLERQASTVAFVHGSRFTSRPLIEASARVAAFAPEALSRVYFVSGGSEATETALKLARQYYLDRDGSSGKYLAIARWHGFHGNTLAALSMSGHVPRRRRYTPLLLDFPHVAQAYCYRCQFGLTYSGCGLECAHDLERMLKSVGPEYVAAFICEPVVGAAAGALVPPPGYLRAVRDICSRYDVLLIADEVMTGFGRTGRNFAVDHWEVEPDIMAVAKGMSAGYYPLGAVLTTEQVFATLKAKTGRFVHGHTYGANPLGAAVCVAVMDVIEREGLVENAAHRGRELLDELKELEDQPYVGQARGLGLLLALELVADRVSRRPFPARLNAAERLTQHTMANGLVVYPGSGHADGTDGDHVLIAPPLCITPDECRELSARLRRAVLSWQEEMNALVGDKS